MTITSIVFRNQLRFFVRLNVRKLLTAMRWWQTMKTNWLTVLSSVSYATFLPLDATRKRGLCCRPVPSVCLSVRPSVRYVGVLYPEGSRYRQPSFSAR